MEDWQYLIQRTCGHCALNDNKVRAVRFARAFGLYIEA